MKYILSKKHSLWNKETNMDARVEHLHILAETLQISFMQIGWDVSLPHSLYEDECVTVMIQQLLQHMLEY